MRILVIDDDEAWCRLLQQMLSTLGCRAEYATSGQKALQTLLKVKIDLVLLDIHLAEMGSLELLEQFRKRNTRTPVVVMTSLPDSPLVQKALRLGARECLAKPLGFEVLRRILRCAKSSRKRSEES